MDAISWSFIAPVLLLAFLVIFWFRDSTPRAMICGGVLLTFIAIAKEGNSAGLPLLAGVVMLSVGALIDSWEREY